MKTDKLLILPKDYLVSETLANKSRSVRYRTGSFLLEDYYQSILGWLTEEQQTDEAVVLYSIEQGIALSERAINERTIWLGTDIIGLMAQVPCITRDESGQHQFTDASSLFSGDLILAAEKRLLRNGIPVRRAVFGAVIAPQLLTPAERSVLSGMGAEVAISGLYLETRAASVRGVPVLGLVPQSLKNSVIDDILSILISG